MHVNAPRGVLRLSGSSSLTNNTSAGGAGGAVMVTSVHLLHLQNVLLADNTAAAGGGGGVGFARQDPIRDLATCVNGVRFFFLSIPGNDAPPRLRYTPITLSLGTDIPFFSLRDAQHTTTQASQLLSSPVGDFALVTPGTLVPAKDLSCEWVLAPPPQDNLNVSGGACRVEMTTAALSAVPGGFANIQVTDADTGTVLFETSGLDGRPPPPLSSSGSGGLIVRYHLRNAASSLIFYGGFLASFRSVCPVLPGDADILSALYGPGSADTADILRQSTLGGFVMYVLENVTAAGNAALGVRGSGGVVDLQLPQGAWQQQTRTGLLVVSGGTMARIITPAPRAPRARATPACVASSLVSSMRVIPLRRGASMVASFFTPLTPAPHHTAPRLPPSAGEQHGRARGGCRLHGRGSPSRHPLGSPFPGKHGS